MNSTPLAARSDAPAGLAGVLQSLWRSSPPLTAVGVLMTFVIVPSVIGLVVDPRIITGAPAWLKPLKFAIAAAIYCLTLAWIFGYLSGWPRTRRIVGWTTAIVFVFEVAIIDAQAWRGTASHFNVSTPLNTTLFFLMGGAILSQTLIAMLVALALWRQEFADRALGWALRFGMTLTLAGAMVGPLMTSPTPAQIADARGGMPMTIAGAHTVGASDGGPGLPMTGWSLEHGDLRVPHFVGLNAVQALAIVALGLGRLRWPERARVHAIMAAAASYVSLFALLLWRALAGESLVAPNATALTAIAIWVVVSAVVMGAIAFGARSVRLTNH